MKEDNSQRYPDNKIAEFDSDYKGPIAARGFGLNRKQQRALYDLWRWMEESLESDIEIGGPLEKLAN